MALLDLNGVKALYKTGLDYAKKKYSSMFFDRNDALSDYQANLVEQATDISGVMNAIWMPNPTWASAFKAPKPICTGCELQYTGIQFGVGHIGWYFLYGVTPQYTFNISFFRLEIAPPEVVTIDRSEAVRWIVLGGYGQVGGPWYTIQPEWIYMKYVQSSYSTFVLAGEGNNIGAVFSTVQPMSFVCNVTFMDSQKQKHELAINMTANTPPTANLPQSCECADGLGSLYYSYTDMNIMMTVNNGPPANGHGWIDHQLMKVGLAQGAYTQALQTVMNTLSKNISGGWLWFAIQDYESGIQYMLTHFFAKKFFQDDITTNVNIPMQLINVYKEGVPYFMPSSPSMDSADLQVVLTKTVNVGGLNMPAEYNITLPGGKQVILRIASSPNVYPTATAPYETPAVLYDSTGQTQIGVGLIEANGYFTNEVMAKRLIAQAGGDANDASQVNTVLSGIEQPQSTGQKILGFIIALIPLFLLILIVYFVLRKKDGRKERLLVAVVAVLICYGLYLMQGK